jgi:hypothetical protein
MYLELEHLRTGIVRRFVEHGVRPLVLLYYSGHGFNKDGRGYLAGSDVDRVDPAARSLAIETALSKLARETVLILLLDACRSDVRPRTTSAANEGKWKGNGIGDPNGSSLYKGVGDEIPPELTMTGGKRKYLIGYAALRLGDPAHSAVSIKDRYSPYTAALLEFLGVEGLELQQELRRITDRVLARTKVQEPTSDGNPGYIYFLWLPEIRDYLRNKWHQLIAEGIRNKIVSFLDDYPDSPFTTAVIKWLADHDKPQ